MAHVSFTTALFLIFVRPALSDEDNHAVDRLKTITVTGAGQIDVAPDKAEIVLGVRSFNKILGTAKSENDEVMKRVLGVLKELGVPPEDYRTEYINIAPVYKQEEYSDRRDQLLGHEVENKLFISLKELSKLDALLTRAVEAGANCIDRVSFQTSKLRERRDEARKMAMRSARDKAVLLSGELGQKIGQARTIREEPQDGRSHYANQAVAVFGGGGGGGGEASSGRSIVSGRIEVMASVVVTFDLN